MIAFCLLLFGLVVGYASCYVLDRFWRRLCSRELRRWMNCRAGTHEYVTDDEASNSRRAYSVQSLWQAADDQKAPTEWVDIAEFDNVLDEDHWFCGQEPSIAVVLLHADRIMQADLRYPILLDPTGHIADGCHRLAKAAWLGRSTIACRRLRELPPPCAEEALINDTDYHYSS